MTQTNSTRRRAGFTLIEVLSAVALLLMIVAAMARIQASATTSFRTQMRQAERDANARAVMDFIGREISQALFEHAALNTGALLTLRYEANTTTGNFGLEGGDEIWFYAANALQANNVREGMHLVYYLRNSEGLANEPPNPQYRFKLMRGYNYATNHAGTLTGFYDAYVTGQEGLNWSGASGSPAPLPGTARMMVDNVRTFEVFAYRDKDGTRVLDWDSRNPEGLFCMDIYLETMSDADAITAAELASSLGASHERTVEFVESVVRRHYQRIYFPNKMAYYDGAGL